MFGNKIIIYVNIYFVLKSLQKRPNMSARKRFLNSLYIYYCSSVYGLGDWPVKVLLILIFALPRQFDWKRCRIEQQRSFCVFLYGKPQVLEFGMRGSFFCWDCSSGAELSTTGRDCFNSYLWRGKYCGPLYRRSETSPLKVGIFGSPTSKTKNKPHQKNKMLLWVQSSM